MTTIEITDIADVQDGDIVTLRWKEEPGITVTLEGPAQDSTVGDFRITRGRFVSATRQAPEWEPGTAGKATVRGIKGVRVMRTSGTGGADVMWLSASMISGVRGHREGEVTDFVPDDASRWAAQAKLVEIDLDNARAEVERWKAEAEMLTAKVDRLMPLQEHENECSYRQRSEKAEAEVERLRAELEGLRDAMDGSTHFLISSGGTIWHHDQNCPNRRTVPTRDQVAEILRARMGGNIEAWHDDADAILALFEQGGSNLRGEAESK